MDKGKLTDLLSQWDRKHTDFLKSIYKKGCLKPSFINDLIKIYSTSNEFECSTSWILKHHFDNGKKLKEEQTDLVLKKLEELEYWENQLHLLQIIPKVHLTQRQTESIEPVIRKLLKSEKKFVKAAAFEAYFEVVKLFPLLKNEFLIICEDALVKESASVKVKIRRILNKLKT